MSNFLSAKFLKKENEQSQVELTSKSDHLKIKFELGKVMRGVK